MHDLMIILIRTILGYLILTILMRVMGKREIGQLSLFDLLILLTIVDVMVIGIENFKDNYLLCLVPMITMAFLQIVFSFLSLKSTSFRQLVDGKEIIIVYHGKPNIENMKRLKYNMDDLYAQLRQKNVRSLKEVEVAIIETSGKLNVFTFQDSQAKYFPLPLIVSGKVNKDVLKVLNLTENWLREQLLKQGIKDYNKILSVSKVDDKLEVLTTDECSVK